MNKEPKASDNLEAIAEEIRGYFLAKDAAREKSLHLSREVIRHSSNAIRAVHRQKKAEAEALLNSAQSLLKELSHLLDEHNDLLHTGFVHDAQKEFAEGSITLALISGEPLPDPKRLGVSCSAYLNGLGEATGELRRYLLDSLRQGDLSRCEELLAIMDDIYGVLVTMDFPEAITHGLRRTTDVVRGILEKTRGDLTLILRQRELEKRLDAFLKQS